MALTSYQTPRETLSPCFLDNGRVVDWVSSCDDFHVSPSPCHNGTRRLAPGPYAFTKTFVRRPFGYLKGGYFGGGTTDRQWYSNGAYGNISGFLTYSYPTFDGLVFENARSTARNRALSKLYSDIRNSEVNLSTSIGEGRETLEMMAAIASAVKHPLDSLTSLVKRPRKGRGMKGARSTALTVSDLWLGWAVGLKPLLHDVESLALHLRSDKSLDIRYYKKARASEELTADVHTDNGREHYAFKQYASYRSEIGVVYCISDMHLFENWRLGLTLRPTLAWELTRLSFVVDYFVQIGAFLEAFEASTMSNGVTFLSGFETTSVLEQTQLSYFREAQPFVDSGASTGEICHIPLEGSASGYTRKTSKNRVLLTSLPSPTVPSFKIPRCGSQLLTVAALLSKFLK